jgi:hypothetical protein
MRYRFSVIAATLVFSVALSAPILAQPIQTPEQFFGFEIGTDGEMARYPKVLEYLQHLAANSDRVTFEELGKSTMGHPYVLVKLSSPKNLSRMDRLVEITGRLSDPRGLSEEEAMSLVEEGVPFYLLFSTIHATEVGNGQAIIEIAHRMATEDSAEIQQILDNTVLLLVPSQNPDGQVLVIDHWYNNKGTGYERRYPDLYHKYVGHDDNRDWFMFTQVETRLAIEKVQNVYNPQLTHDMHQMGSTGARIWVPPFKDPYDPNIHPIIMEAQAQIGLAMAAELIADGKSGIAYATQYDYWAPARQYMVYHGQPRILTELASANLADPYVNPAGEDKPLGPQEIRWNFPKPYKKGIWRLGDIVDYAVTAEFGGLKHMAKYHDTWLENFYKIHRDWVTRDEPPYAFVIPAEQRDPFETYEMLEILDTGDVEIHQAKAAFTAGGKDYPAGSWVVLLDQPSGAFAKTMLEKQIYPDLRYFEGGPPIPPYDVTAQTLGMLMGVDVMQVEGKFDAELEHLEEISPPPAAFPRKPNWAYLIGPESNAGFLALARLQKENVPVFRAAKGFQADGEQHSPGTWIIPPKGKAGAVLQAVSKETGLKVSGTNRAPRVDGYRMKSPTRIGLYKVANNMPAGWMMWLFEQYGFNHQVMSSEDFAGDLSTQYDVVVLPAGTSKQRMIEGLSPDRHDETWKWAYGIGESGWDKLAKWVENGGTLVALGNSVETARELCDLPIEKLLPDRPRRRRSTARPDPRDEPQIPKSQADQMLKDAFQSPTQLMKTLRDNVVNSATVFFCPGSLLEHQYNPNHPVAFGMPSEWPIFFRYDQAYRIKPGFDIEAEVVTRYPDEEDLVASGWLLGGDLLRDQANIMAFKVGRGNVVALASQVSFRTQPRATFKLLFNALYQGPAIKLSSRDLSRMSTKGGRTTEE